MCEKRAVLRVSSFAPVSPLVDMLSCQCLRLSGTAGMVFSGMYEVEE
jgi:hypothetical protein